MGLNRLPNQKLSKKLNQKPSKQVNHPLVNKQVKVANQRVKHLLLNNLCQNIQIWQELSNSHPNNSPISFQKSRNVFSKVEHLTLVVTNPQVKTEKPLKLLDLHIQIQRCTHIASPGGLWLQDLSQRFKQDGDDGMMSLDDLQGMINEFEDVNLWKSWLSIRFENCQDSGVKFRIYSQIV